MRVIPPCYTVKKKNRGKSIVGGQEVNRELKNIDNMCYIVNILRVAQLWRKAKLGLDLITEF